MAKTQRFKNLKEIKAFGKKVRSIRENLGYTQEQVAARAEVSFPTINRIEQGHVNPRIDTVFSIADALKTDPHKLFE